MDTVLTNIKKIALQYPHIKRVVLFGSRARGDFTLASDYDIAVFCSDNQTECLFCDEIDNILTLHKLDVVFIKGKLSDSRFHQNIKRDGVVIMDRFISKLENFQQAMARLQESIAEAENSASLTMRDGVIQRFEFTAELAWKTVKAYLQSEAIGEINGPKSVMKEAFANHLIQDEAGWIQLLNDRNVTSHLYDEAVAEEIYQRIIHKHRKLFGELLGVLENKRN